MELNVFKYKMEIFNIPEQFDIGVKRFCLPLIIRRACPKCGEECKLDLEQNYLSYPTVNKREVLNFYCTECKLDFEVDSILSIFLEVEKV